MTARDAAAVCEQVGGLFNFLGSLDELVSSPADAVSFWTKYKIASVHEDCGTTTKMGMSLFDAALFLTDEEREATSLVKKWSDSTHQNPPILGKCPRDRRRNLSELSDIMDFVDLAHSLEGEEKRELKRHLSKLLRRPAQESSRK